MLSALISVASQLVLHDRAELVVVLIMCEPLLDEYDRVDTAVADDEDSCNELQVILVEVLVEVAELRTIHEAGKF